MLVDLVCNWSWVKTTMLGNNFGVGTFKEKKFKALHVQQ
jgi:hypothetical protein